MDEHRPLAAGAEEDAQLQHTHSLGGAGAEGLQSHNQVVQVYTAIGDLAHSPHQDHQEGEHEQEMGVPRTTAPSHLRPDANDSRRESRDAVEVACDGRLWLPAVNHSGDELKWILSMGSCRKSSGGQPLRASVGSNVSACFL